MSQSENATAPSENPQQASAGDAPRPGLPQIDVNEYGGKKDGVRQAMNRRLFMQVLVFDAPLGTPVEASTTALTAQLKERDVAGVVYADVNAPRGIGLATWSTDPSHFVRAVRPLFSAPTLRDLVPRTGWTMLGRTYATGHEPDLEHVLLHRPVGHMKNEALAWHVWYPLRRTGAFARLDPAEQGAILREHAQIGMAYGQADLGHDVRLACHGLDAEDNEFVIGLVGRELHPLSHLVQTMRSTKQTSEYIAKMGPFFVGYVISRHAR